MKKFASVLVIALILIAGFVVFSKSNTATKNQVANESIISTSPTQDIVTSADNAPTRSIHNLPVPEPVAAARKTAAEYLGVPEGETIVMSAHEKEWSDSCLGLGQANESCLQVITPGYEVAVKGNGKEVVYRTNSDGSVIRRQE